MREINRCHALALLTTGSLLVAPAFVVQVFAVPDAIGFNGALPSLNKVKIESGNVYDYTFAQAPVDWRAQSGTWAMTNRWSCAPGWSWFGGRSQEVAALWNKRKFSGDFSVQVYFAFKMGMPGANLAWREHPSDIAISFCGDGQNLGSGYSLIIGAGDNRHTILQKQGFVVAESAEPEALFVSFADGIVVNRFTGGTTASVSTGRAVKGTAAGPGFGTGSSAPANRVPYGQTHWWYAKVNKIGDRVECWLDNKLLFVYNDPEPLNAGQLALWTYSNGIMLSRVQIYYENEVKNVLLPRKDVPDATPITFATQGVWP